MENCWNVIRNYFYGSCHLQSSFFFFLNDPAPPEISPFPLRAALPISIGGGGRRPAFVKMGTEREIFLFLFLAQHARVLSFPPFEFHFCSGKIAQALFPLGFEAAC